MTQSAPLPHEHDTDQDTWLETDADGHVWRVDGTDGSVDRDGVLRYRRSRIRRRPVV